MSEKIQETRTNTATPHDFRIEENPMNRIRRSVAVMSGKGGVGKSLVTSLLATYLSRTGKYRVGILDADITGPSIPKLMGVDKTKAKTTDIGIFPVRSIGDIQVMSINLLLDEPEAPVVWRGPILSNTVQQFWTDVIWGEIDFMFLDMPPGTGDVPLTVFQSIPLSGIIIVTSPQDLVTLIVQKAVNMARMMNVPILGLIENMSYAICPHCGETIHLFGESKSEKIAREWDIPFLGSLPVDPDLASLGDAGQIEKAPGHYLGDAVKALENLEPRSNPLDGMDHQAVQSESARPGETEANEVHAGASLVAVATENGSVAGHFGHCAGFTLYTIRDSQIVDQSYIANPGHKPGVLPDLLAKKGASVIIAGGMGGGAISRFNHKGIEVITGAAGELDQVIARYLDGQLISDGATCHKHEHADDCEQHDGGGHNHH